MTSSRVLKRKAAHEWKQTETCRICDSEMEINQDAVCLEIESVADLKEFRRVKRIIDNDIKSLSDSEKNDQELFVRTRNWYAWSKTCRRSCYLGKFNCLVCDAENPVDVSDASERTLEYWSHAPAHKRRKMTVTEAIQDLAASVDNVSTSGVEQELSSISSELKSVASELYDIDMSIWKKCETDTSGIEAQLERLASRVPS